MAGVRIDGTIDDREIREALRRLTAVAARPAAALDEIGSRLGASTLLRFEREEAPDGTPWERSQRAMAEGGQTLTDTARLRQSITHNVIDGGTAVEIGSNVIYAAIHQYGGEAGRDHAVTLPARPYLGLSPGDRRSVLGIIGRHLRRAVA